METTYKGKTITLDERTFRFTIEGLDSQCFESMVNCHNYIDEALKREELQERKKLALPVITRAGERTTITGIHGNTGNVTLKPKLREEREFGGIPYLYVDVEWIGKLLIEIIDLDKALREKLKNLQPFMIEKRREYGRLSFEKLQAKLEHVQDEYNAKLAQAREAD